MKLRKILATLVALALVGGLAITVSANQVELRLDEDEQIDGVATIVYYFTSIVADSNGAIDGNVFIGLGDQGNVQKSVANEGSLFTEQNKDIFLDEGQASIRVDLGGAKESVGGYVGINLWTVGSYGIDRYEFLDASGNLVATVTPAGVVTLGGTATAPAADSGAAPAPIRDDSAGGAKAGVGDVAVASAVALVAAGAVVFSRKKK
ncbi:MAG: hypothetical protein LBC86_04555 [Oscillospiraceae bacterium]|jgi:hypothetical protein|nr:hypothetical protein [Oscillospiraceae bacterium]